jgi:hypothetical protein
MRNESLTVSSIKGTPNRANLPVGRSSPAGGAELDRQSRHPGLPVCCLGDAMDDVERWLEGRDRPLTIEG